MPWEDPKLPDAPKPSTIRLMTRLAHKNGAINLSQGFPNDPPPVEPVTQMLCGVITGSHEEAQKLAKSSIEDLFDGKSVQGHKFEEIIHYQLAKRLPGDMINQYSDPKGKLELRLAIEDFYKRYYGWEDVCAETMITVGLGATEPFATTLRTICAPGEHILIFQPFHELYPNQASLFYIKCMYTTLEENEKEGKWEINWKEFEEKAIQCRAIVINTPHNPTGKVFSKRRTGYRHYKNYTLCREAKIASVCAKIIFWVGVFNSFDVRKNVLAFPALAVA